MHHPIKELKTIFYLICREVGKKYRQKSCCRKIDDGVDRIEKGVKVGEEDD
jgi:hypothetical protein